MGKAMKGGCRCRPDEYEYQDVMSGYWYLQHRKSCPLRKKYEAERESRGAVEGKATASGRGKGPGGTDPYRGLSKATRDDLQCEKELLVDLIAQIDGLLLTVKHAIEFHQGTGIFEPGLTELEFAWRAGMVKGERKGKRPTSNAQRPTSREGKV